MKKTLALLLSFVLLMQPFCGALAAGGFMLPGGLKTISEEAFAGDTSITGVITLPEKVETVGASAFAGTDVWGLKLTENTKNVGSGVLAGAGANYVVAPGANTVLADGALDGVNVLVGDPSLAGQAGSAAFYPIDEVEYENGFAYWMKDDHAVVIFASEEKSGEIRIPEKVKGLPVLDAGSYAFSGLDGVTKITLPLALSLNIPTTGPDWPEAEFETTGGRKLALSPSSVTMVPGEWMLAPKMLGLPGVTSLYDWTYKVSEGGFVLDEEDVENPDELIPEGTKVFVDGEGTITALAPGQVTVQYIAVSDDTTYFGDITVTVTEPQLFFEYEDTAMTVEVGQAGYLPIEIGSTAHSVAVKTKYESSDPETVSVYENGMVFGNKLGTADVTVTATLPAIGKAEEITKTATFTVTVTEPQIKFEFQNLYTYTGWSYDMKYLEGYEPAEGASVAWKSADSSIATVDDKGHVEILKTGETALTCEITEGETVRTATIPVSVRENPHFTQDVEIRDGLIADWEYHPFWESLQPKVSDTLWPHDEGALVISATSEDANVMKFDYQYRYDEYENREKVLVAYAGNPGETTVTYSVGFAPEFISALKAKGGYAPAADTDSFTVRVRAPEMEVEIWTDEDVLQFGTTSQIHYYVESESFIENVVFKSSNPDVISVDPEGKLLATGGGKATITMTVYSFGTSVSASTEVTVLGYALKFEPDEITIKVGENVSVAPTWTLPDGSHISNLGNDGAGFVSDNEAIAYVDWLGMVTGIAPGSVGVHIETYGIALNEEGEYETTDERVRAYMTVHVVEDDPQLILKNEEGKAVSFVEIYPNVPYALGAYDAAGKKVENVEWTVSSWSDPEGRATVKDGFVTLHYDWADESEYVYVTATAEVGGETVSTTCAFNALRPVLSIGDYFGYYRLENGESTQFEYHVFKGEGAPACTVELLSENPELVKADTVLNTITACEEGSGVTTVHAILKADGKEVGRVSSIVHVNSDLPTGEEITSFGPVNERTFFLPGTWAWIGRSITPDTYWPYFDINLYSDNEDVVEVHGDEIHTVGEGEANLIYELYSYEDSETAIERLEVPVTVGLPKANVTVYRGENEDAQIFIAGDDPIHLETDDVVTITSALPENAMANVWWNYDDNHFREIIADGTQITLKVIRPTDETGVGMYMDLIDYWDAEMNIPFVISGDEIPHLDHAGITFGVNEFAHIWPEFGHEGRYELNGEWYGYELIAEDPTIVEVVDPDAENAWDNPLIKGLKVGETTVTGRYLVNTNDPENPDDDEYIEITIPVSVVNPEWTLHGLNIPTVMIAGRRYDAHYDIETNTNCGEQAEFTFSDDSILEFSDEDGWQLIAKKPGKVTVTLTVTRGDGSQQTVSQEVTVVDLITHFSEDEYVLDQGSSKLLRLIDKTGKKISDVYYSFKNPLWFDIELDSDKDLTPYITVKEDAVAGSTILTAKVAYDDGTTAVASTYIHIQDEPYIDVWMDEEYDGEIEMHVIQTDIHELRAVEARMDTNLHNVTESFVSSNPEVVTVSSQGALLKHKPGESIITYTASAGDISASVDVKVIVTGWEISLYPTEIEMTPGEAVFVTPDLHLEDGRELDFNPEQGWYYTTNEDVAYVDHEGLVTALAPGKTSVSYSYEVEEGNILYARTEVTVNPDIPKDEAGEPVAKPLTITLKNAEGEYVPVTKTTIKPRQTLELGIEHDGKLTGEINWSSSDGNISFYEGNIAHLDTWDIYGSYCTFYIRCDAEIDGEMQTAYLLLEYLQTQATLISPPNFYEVSVGQNAQVEWSYTVADPSMTIKPVFSIVDPAIALVDNRGIISGITPGVTMVRLDLYDAETNEWLTSGAAYVYVDTPIPAPDFAFGQPFYYFDLTSDNRDHEQGTWFEDPQGTLVFYDEVRFASDDEDIVEIDEHGTMHAHNAGKTTIRAWVDGYEDKAATAEVLVAEPYLTADKEQNEDGVYQMKVGELITFTMHDVPDADNELYPLEEIYRDLQSMDVVDMKHEGTEITITAFARNEDYIDGHIGASFPNRGIEFRLNVNIDPVNGDYRFGEEALTAVVGETITLWPDFDWEEIRSVSVDDEEILELVGDYENPITFTTLKPGKATLSAEVLPSDAESYDDTHIITATVLVSEDDTWDLESIDGIPDIMMVGVHYYDVWAGIRYNGYYWPHTSWTFGDDSLIEVVENEDEEPYFLPLKAGTTTLTVTVEKDGEVQSMEKTITIVDPFVRFIWTGASLRPGQTLYAPLSISPKLLRDVVSIEFTVDDENIVQVNGPYRYNGYTHTAEIIPVADKGETRIHASVGLKDGTVYSASMPVFITENKDVWLNVHDGYELDLSTRPWGNEPMRDSVWVNWDTNAALTTDGGTDYIRIEWSDYDDGVIRVGEGDLYNNGVTIEALRAGETGLTAYITLCDGEGNVISERETHFYVCVHEPWIKTSANRDHVEVRVNESEHISFDWHAENFAPITRRVLRSDNENIARINTDDHVYGVHPGETTIFCDYYCGEYIVATHEVPVTVFGAEIYIGPNDMTIEVGQSYYIGELVNLYGLEDHGFEWRSTNPAAAAVSANGLVYGVAPGEAQIHGIQNTNDGEFIATASVRVVGEAPAFALSANALTLYPEQSYTFEFGDNVDLDTLYWEISTDEGMVEFNEHTLTVTALDNTDREKFAVLTFTAKVDGERQTAACHITLPERRLVIREHQFGEGRWQHLNTGDTMGVHEQYVCTDPSLRVDVEIWTDDPGVLYWSDYDQVFYAMSEGETTAYYKVTASSGESYTRSLFVRVSDEYTFFPTSIAPEHADHAYVVNLDWREGGFPIINTPEYTWCDMEFTSSDDGVVFFDENDTMYFENPGRVTVTAKAAEGEPVDFGEVQGEVLVLDPERIQLVAYDSEGNPVDTVIPGQTVQLGFIAEDGGVLWEERDVESIEYRNYYGEYTFILSEDGQYTRVGPWSDENNIDVIVRFKSGMEQWFRCKIYTDANESEYATLVMNPDDLMDYHVNFVGERSEYPLLLMFNRNVMGELTDLRFDSSDESIAKVDEEDQHIQCGSKPGKATITAYAEFENGKTYTDTFEVTVLKPTTLEIGFSANLPHGANVVQVGDIIELYTWFEDEDLERGGVGATEHWYVSSDPAIMDTLENLDIEDGSGHEWMRAKALEPGKVTITTHAHYTFDNSITDSESMTFYVVEPPMAQMEVSRGEIRPGETMTARLNVVKEHVPLRSIEWSSENEQIATVYTEGDTPTEALITGVAEGDDTRVKAVVTFEDDTSCEVYCNIHIVKNSEVWVDAKEYEIYLGTADWDYNVQTIWQTWTHNASHFDEIGEGTDQAWIDWSIDDPSIIEFIGQELNEEGEIRAPWNNGMMIRGLKEGETFVRTTLTLTDEHGNYLASDTAVYPVYVHQSQAAYFASDNHDIRPGATRRIEVAVNEDSGMEIESVEFEAQNDMITVEDVSADGEFAVSVTATSEDTEIGQSGVFAHVTYADGGEDTIHFDLHLIHDEDVFIEVFPYEITLSDARFGDHPMFEEAWAYMRSNMHLAEDGGSDKLNIEWESDDIGIAYVGEKIDEHPYNNGYYIHAGRAGHTTLHAKVTVTNADDQVIAFADAEFPIEVRETKLEAGFREDYYEVSVGRTHYIGYNLHEENHQPITRVVLGSYDENIVRFHANNELWCVNPGETEIYLELYCGEYLVYYDEAHVRCTGASISLSTERLILEVGQSAIIDAVTNTNGLEDRGCSWQSSNPNVAAIDNNGLVHAAAPGEAILTFRQHTNDGDNSACVYVTVNGSVETALLDVSTLTLLAEQSHTFTLTDGADMDSVVWAIEDPEGVISFDEETMTVTASVNTGTYRGALVTCTANVNGEQITESCHIIVPDAKLRIMEHQFGQGNWNYLECGWYMDIHEQYRCSDPSLAVTVEIWTDDPEIASYNAEENRIYAHAKGDTMAHYRASASNGESYTRSMLIRVETGEPMQSLEVRYPDYAYVVAQSDYDAWFPIITAPDYAYGRVLFSSSDEGVVSFDDGEDSSHMFFGYDHHHAGRATITARIASDEDFTLPEVRGEVLVLDEDAIELVPVDEEGNPNGDYEILPGESIQLGFIVHEGGVFWEEKDVERIEYINYYGNSQFTVTEDGLVTRTGPWSDPFNVFARVFFKSGYWTEFCCELYCPADEAEYFALMLENDDHLLEYTNFIGTLSELPLCARFNRKLMGNITSLTFESSNENIAKIEWSEGDHGDPFIRCGDTAGTAIITGTGTFEDGRVFTDTFEVTTIDPTEFDIQIGSSLDDGSNIVFVGDTIELYCGYVDEALAYSHADSKTQVFTSSDPSVMDTLENLGENYGSGLEWMTMRAIKPGKVTITVDAHSNIHPELTDSDQMTVYVVERPLVQMDTTSVSLRPGETREVYANVNGDASEVTAINWYSDDESAVTVTVDEENGHHAYLTGSAVSGEAESKDARVRAELTFANGDTYTVYCNVHITGNDEIWLNAKQHEMWLGTADWDYNVQTIWQIWTHNASHFDEIGKGTDKAWIDWTIDDPTIAEFVDLEKDENGNLRAPWNNGMMIRGLKEGETFVRTTLTLFDANDNEIAVDHAVYPVYVHQSYAASFDVRNNTLRLGQDREFPIAVNEESGMVIDTIEFIPDNDMIEVTDASADGKFAVSVKAVSEEEDSGVAARITYTNGYEEEIWQWVNIVTDDEVEIEVFPYDIRLAAVDYASIPMKEEVWLGIYCPLYIEADGGTDKLWIEWWTDDPDVAYVGEKIDDNPVNNGYYIHGANPGETTLRAKVTARNGSGDELASTVAEFPVEVVEAYFHPWADNDSYVQSVGDYEYVGFRYDEEWTKTPVFTTTSSNTDVAITTPDDRVLVVGPGEATITRTYSFPGSETTFSASTEFFVSGPYTPTFTLNGEEITELTIAMGDEPVILGTNVDYNGSEYDDDHAFSTNEPVLNVEYRYNEETGWHDIVVTPVAPGEATVVYELNTSHGDVYAYLPVTVTGEAEFTLNKTRMTLLCEASEQLTIVTGLGEPDSIKWESNKGYVWVDEDGTVHAGENDRGETPATITCTATYGDTTYVAGCEVTVPARKLYPMERMFNNRQIFSMWVDDYQYIHESYMTTDPALEITEKIDIENPEILELTEDGQHLHALKKGDTTVTYTLSASNGEKYVRTALFRVEPELNLTSIAPAHETFVVYQEWNQHYFPLVTDPLNLPFNGHPTDGDGPRLHFYFESSDDGILSFDHNSGSEMYFDADHYRPGRVEVTVTYADNPEISFTSDVLVLNESIEVGVEGDRDLRTFYQNDEVQLTFYPGDHGVIWEDEDVDWINWRNYYGDAFTISEDGVLKINSDWNTGDEWIHLWVDVYFKSGTSYTTCFDFKMNPYNENSKIAFLTGSTSQGAEEFNAVKNVKSWYDGGLVLHDTYPDNFADDTDTTTDRIVSLAEDETVKAVIVAQAVPGTVAGFEEILAMCDDQGRDAPLLIACMPQEPLDELGGKADFILYNNEPNQAGWIVTTVNDWGCDMFVHISFARHMEISSVSTRAEYIANDCSGNDITYVAETITDPANDYDKACADTLALVEQYTAENPDKKIAFFATNCGVQATLQSAVLSHGNAYYPQPCCPSPFHGFGASLGLDLNCSSEEALRRIAAKLSEHGAVGRFSTWAYPVNQVLIETAGKYAMDYANGIITYRYDTDTFCQIIEDRWPNTDIAIDGNHYISLQLDPVDFADYIN